MVAAAALMMFGNSASAQIVDFRVEATYRSNANENPPFTSPDGAVSYSFQLDSADAAERDGPGIVFRDVVLEYSLNGVSTTHTANVTLANAPEGSPVSRLNVLNVDGRQLNINLPPVQLFEMVEGGGFSILPSMTEFTGGFLGADFNDRFEGTLNIGPPEPMVLNVPDDFPTIQGAVDAAMPGDKILVHGGCYTELVHVETPGIEIRGKGCAVLHGTFSVVADNVTIKNWKIFTEFHDQAVRFFTVDGCVAKNLIIIGGTRGMWLRNATNCRVRNCWIFDTELDAIGCADLLDGTQIRGNVFVGQNVGMFFFPSMGATVRNNFLIFSQDGTFAAGDLEDHTFRRNYPRN